MLSTRGHKRGDVAQTFLSAVSLEIVAGCNDGLISALSIFSFRLSFTPCFGGVLNARGTIVNRFNGFSRRRPQRALDKDVPSDDSPRRVVWTYRRLKKRLSRRDSSAQPRVATCRAVAPSEGRRHELPWVCTPTETANPERVASPPRLEPSPPHRDAAISGQTPPSSTLLCYLLTKH
jgi:hypothetical protein